MDKGSLSIALRSIAGRIGQLSMRTPAVATVAGIAAIAWALASLMPRYWALGELVLLAACILLIREGTVVYARVPSGRAPEDSVANRKAWSAGNSTWFDGPSAKQQNSWQRSPSLREFAAAGGDVGRTNSGVGVTRNKVDGTNSDEMLAHVFSRASLKHRSDDAGDPENIPHV